MKFYNQFFQWVLICLIVVVLPNASAVGASAVVDPSPFPLVLLDGANRTVKLTAPPTRIVSLSPAATDILLLSVGVRPELVGVTRYCQIPTTEEKRIVRVGGVIDPDYERIASLKPDLVVAPQLADKTLQSKLTSLGLTVIVLHPEGLQGVLDDIRMIGKATGHTASGEAAAKAIEGIRALAATRWRGVASGDRPRVLVRMGDLSPAPGSYMDDLITAAGGRNVIPRGPKAWVQISPEGALQLNPTLIVDIPSPDQPADQNKAAVPSTTKTNSANQPRKVILKDGDAFNRPGPAVGQALWELGRAFYPQLFPEPSPPIGSSQATASRVLP